MYQVGGQIQVIQASLEQVAQKFNTYGVMRITQLREELGSFGDERYMKKKLRSYPYDDDDGEYVVGLDKDIPKLIQVLMGEGKEQLSILSIVGMGGCGKTTLARKLYNHPYTRECFDCTAWVFVSQDWNTQHILLEILRKVVGPKNAIQRHASSSVEELVDKLRGILRKKLYLVVLDDVWRREAIEEILPALPRATANKGSKIIITTRNKEIVQFPTLQPNQYIYEPQPLTDDEAWELFSKIALSHRSNFDVQSFENLAKQMLKKCDGLPLAIIRLSGILNTKDSITEWEQVSQAVLSRVMQGTATRMYSRVGDLLALSYDDLPYNLKACFLYLGVFPEDCQIPAGMLTRMWIAEGLVTACEGMSAEDVATQRLEELSHRFMVQVVRVNFKGEIKAVRLHDLLRDLCLKKAKEQNFLETYSPISDQTRPADHTSPLDIEPRRAALHSSVSIPVQVAHLRSLVLLTRSSVSYTAYDTKETLSLEIAFNNFTLLRLLNLWGINTVDGTLPAQIGSLIHLRYLGLRASNITQLPVTIGNLRNLLTLDYRNIESSNHEPIKIPNVLHKLVALRHLFLPIECPWTVVNLELSTLKNLRILWGIKEERGGNWLSTELLKLSTTVKKLKIMVYTEKDLTAAFSSPSLGGLDSFYCELQNNVALQLVEPISHHRQLHKLILVGEIRMQLSLILPCNLITLDLKDSRIKEEDPMVAIGPLPRLKLLRMSNSYSGTIFTCKRGSFPQLEELYLENLDNLDTWVVEKESMLCLKKLELVGCRKLRHFPGGLPFVKSLQQLELVEVPKELWQKATEYGWSQKKLRLPQNYEAIIGQCDTVISVSSVGKLYDRLTAGVFLNDKKQKFWVVKQDDRYYNCFMLYIRGLSICLHDDKLMDAYMGIHQNSSNSWEWRDIAESDGTQITISELGRSSEDEFHVRGKFDTENLSFPATYQVAYIVMLPESARSEAIMDTYSYPSGPFRRYNHRVGDKPKGEWVRLSLGQFHVFNSIGEIHFVLDKIVPGTAIKGIIVEPKASSVDVGSTSRLRSQNLPMR